MDPWLEWSDAGVLRAKRWYPCIEFYPEEDGLRLHLDLYGFREHPRLSSVEGNQWNALRLTDGSQIDVEVAAWICEALDVGNMK